MSPIEQSPIEQPFHGRPVYPFSESTLPKGVRPVVTSSNQRWLNRNTHNCGTMRTLTGWKEIATFLRRGVRTIQRWESLGLPVHRTKGGRSSPVFAFAEELDAWEKATPTRFSNAVADLKAKVESLEIKVTSLRQQLKYERQRSSLQDQSAVTRRGADRARVLRPAIQ